MLGEPLGVTLRSRPRSGLGREGGRVGIDEFLETKYVGIGGI
ncbi:hypothetical protein [Nocardiopsis dassonvillei]